MEKLNQSCEIAKVMESEEKFPSLLYEANKQFIKGCLQTEDDVVKEAFIEIGMLYTDDFIKNIAHV